MGLNVTNNTPRPVRIWDREAQVMRDSDREYIDIGHIRGDHEPEGSYRLEAVDLTLYLDRATGLVVFDVAAYERTFLGPRAVILDGLV